MQAASVSEASGYLLFIPVSRLFTGTVFEGRRFQRPESFSEPPTER